MSGRPSRVDSDRGRPDGSSEPARHGCGSERGFLDGGSEASSSSPSWPRSACWRIRSLLCFFLRLGMLVMYAVGFITFAVALTLFVVLSAWSREIICLLLEALEILPRPRTWSSHAPTSADTHGYIQVCVQMFATRLREETLPSPPLRPASTTYRRSPSPGPEDDSSTEDDSSAENDSWGDAWLEWGSESDTLCEDWHHFPGRC
ncbi:uncharacterized protein THITE_2128591 [Thermothielavioides terrestris NRRL 8126]|uniref:Uncharacterized protein n=1 Tax=Thermothielavioides terrestris (strain ATCC 38088 / NRRL 8126) TaxID=578455 RepID=G2R143_THETT|nr:uncharacterized protein THITE_2128591 [Thermothielavioides terrestris NRRL 8126]AEO66540.1 hypothetical protein THITE_2128591 [Thermothielavioides terrestris NRRL 8126]